MTVPDARRAIKREFMKNTQIKDKRIVEMTIEKGYMELEDTLLQWKQRSQLIRLLEGYVRNDGAARKKLGDDATADEVFARSGI